MKYQARSYTASQFFSINPKISFVTEEDILYLWPFITFVLRLSIPPSQPSSKKNISCTSSSRPKYEGIKPTFSKYPSTMFGSRLHHPCKNKESRLLSQVARLIKNVFVEHLIAMENLFGSCKYITYFSNLKQCKHFQNS